MKYKVIIEKNVDNQYFAYCLEAKNLHARGVDVSSVLHNLQQELICYLHDSDIELDIVLKGMNGNEVNVNYNFDNQRFS